MTDELMDHLNRVAHYKQLDYNFHPADEAEWRIAVSNKILSCLCTLDMRFQTYAEGSWTQNVWKAFNTPTIAGCDCDDCYKWKMRMLQINEEIEYAISCLMQAEVEQHG